MARPQDRDEAGRPTKEPHVESERIVERIVPPTRPEREESFGTWEPRLRAGRVPIAPEPGITWRQAFREGRRASATALVLVVAGLVVAVVVWQIAEFIDVLVR